MTIIVLDGFLIECRKLICWFAIGAKEMVRTKRLLRLADSVTMGDRASLDSSALAKLDVPGSNALVSPIDAPGRLIPGHIAN